jgi:hypothetical protein
MDKRCLSAVALLTGVLALGVTSAAQAGHVNVRFGVRTCGTPVPSCGVQTPTHCSRQMCTSSCAHGKYLFDKGYRAGKSAGWRAGHSDGRYGRVFCDVQRNKVRHQPYHFRKGFKLGFRQGYASGYEQGKRERYRRYRCRWW